jgi:L,D-peptidoglycan transpeptidase YkuD (ErfK/YbiS/YcfS/YnhG family)
MLAPAITPDGMRGLEHATRAIVVQAPSRPSTRAVARTYARATTTGRWRQARPAMPARLGRNGLSTPARRHEGDGTTPMGTLGFVYGFGSRPDPGVTGFAWRRLSPTSCWAVSRAAYNRWIDASPCPGEDLWASARLAYRYAAVIDFNYGHPVYGRGSGIFLHVQTGRPTAGCVSLAQRDLLPVLRWLRPGTRIVIGTTAYLRSLR